MGLNAAEIIDVLREEFSVPFEMKGETPLYFTLGTADPGLQFQFHQLPVCPEDETEPLVWQEHQQEASRHGFRLVHIWEDQWRRQRQIVLSRMGAKLGLSRRIHGRETAAKRVGKEKALEFFREHHLQVPLAGKYRYGLFYKEELVSLAAFSGGRRMKNEGKDYRSFELIRFCHAGPALVQGGLSKLIVVFAREFGSDDIMTYIDLDWSEGQAFKSMGFKVSGITAPQVFWISPVAGIRYYPGRLPPDLQEASASQLHEAGYFRIYNSGSLKMARRFDLK